MIEWQEITKKMQQLEKEVFEKNIVIGFLTKQLEKSNKKHLANDKSNKENKPSNTNIQKHRNTVSAVKIISKNETNPPK